jgi:hypothetical protein
MKARPNTAIVVTVAGLAAIFLLQTHRQRALPSRAVNVASPSEPVWTGEIPDDVAIAKQTVGEAIDPFVLSDLQFVMQNVRGLVAEGRERCAELGEPSYEPGDPGQAGRRHVAAWNRFSQEWNEDLTEAAASLPAPPDWDAQPEAALAYQDIGRAIQELRLVPVGTGEWSTPFESLWSSRFDIAEALLASASRQLDALAARNR